MKKLLVLFSICFCLFLPSGAEARRKHRKQSSVPVALQHSKVKQKQQNRAANKYKLVRIKNLAEMKKRIAAKDSRRLVLVSDTSFYYLDKKMGSLDPSNKIFYHYTCTWVKDFLDKDLAEVHQKTGVKFRITSLTRPQDYQVKLNKRNKGAIVGKKWWQKSSHSTCATVDISFYRIGSAGKRELRKKLVELQRKSYGIAVEEKGSGHFHVMVFPTYK